MHNFGNFVVFMGYKSKQGQIDALSGSKGVVSSNLQGKLLLLHDKSYGIVDYPVSSQQYNYSIQELLPDQSRNVLFQNNTFFIEGTDIKSFSLSDGTIHNIFALKKYLQGEDIKFYNMEFRPITLAHTDTGKFLISFQMDNIQRMMAFQIKIQDSSTADSTREILCVQSFFLGRPSFRNPPILILNEDYQKVHLEWDVANIQDAELAELYEQNKSSM